ncbi:hypothetical protein HanRHA438_Chr04g0181071 [Helianthus annuus]|nr:hypothetical protein HanRHA438_Chr04g0181071 [Helianthus annuus]
MIEVLLQSWNIKKFKTKKIFEACDWRFLESLQGVSSTAFKKLEQTSDFETCIDHEF